MRSIALSRARALGGDVPALLMFAEARAGERCTSSSGSEGAGAASAGVGAAREVTSATASTQAIAHVKARASAGAIAPRLTGAQPGVGLVALGRAAPPSEVTDRVARRLASSARRMRRQVRRGTACEKEKTQSSHQNTRRRPRLLVIRGVLLAWGVMLSRGVAAKLSARRGYFLWTEATGGARLHGRHQAGSVALLQLLLQMPRGARGVASMSQGQGRALRRRRWAH